jgi:uncharacterized repeat protein (TIGR01451 family)
MRRSISLKLSYSRRRDASLIAAVVILVLLGGSAGRASAAEPWWHVNTVSAPASQPGGEGRLVLEVTNLGDAAVNGATNPVTIEDTLPAGVVPTHVYGEGGGSFRIGINGVKELIHCSFHEGVVTCSYAGPLLEYERFMIAITVNVTPGSGTGVSEVSVSGGGAPPVVSRHALALGDSPSPFGVENYELTPEEEGGAPDTQAGSHPFQLTSTLTFNTKAAPVFFDAYNETLPEVQPVGLTKDLRFVLPAGLVGNPTPLPQCRLSVFLHSSNTSKCPNSTVVGVATPIITNVSIEPYVPIAPTSPLYSLEPSVGEPARFGFNTSLGPIILDTSVQTGDGYNVVVTVPNIPSYLPFIGSQVTFWGVPDDSRHDTSRGSCLDEYKGTIQNPEQVEFSCPLQEKPQPFLIMPTSCTGPLQSTVSGDSWEAIGQYAPPKLYTFANGSGEPVAQDGCNQLSFEPSIKVTPDGQQASTPTGLGVDVHVDQEASLNPAGLTDANVKDTTVTLPVGVGLNPSGADGLSACPLLHGTERGQEEAEEKHEITGINLETRQPANCPESAKVASVKIKTPLLPHELEGAAYLATQNANPFDSLIALYIVAYDPVSGVLVKLAGEVQPNPVTGQLVSTFKETPQLPFEDLSLHFYGGARAPLGTPAACGSYTTSASISPWSGNAPVAASSEFQITSGPEVLSAAGPVRTGCASPLPFTPSLTGGSLNLQAGAFTPFVTTFSREDGDQNLQAIELHMPPGLLGTLSHVQLCGEPQANEGACGPESLVGETTVSVGLGGDPYTVTGGKVYITGPFNGSGPCTPGTPGCAPYGLSIVNPAVAGPFNLGQVVVRAKIEVNPTTAALTIVTDPSGPYAIPHILDGIPLQIKHVNVNINRSGFTFNPTSCNPLQITGTLKSSEGSTSALAVPLQVTNCATLAFKPHLAASTSGKTSKALGASLAVKLTYPAGPYDANIARVKVDLPKQLPSRLTTLQKACTAAQFESNPAGCPAASIIGQARAVTPVLPVPLEGPAIFVSHGGEAFPSLIIVLQGYGTTVDLVGTTFISKSGVTSSTFKTVPDVPVGTFELNLPEKKFSALAASLPEKDHGNLCKVKLAMPTSFVAQNGAEIHTSTPITTTGCPKGKKATKKKGKGKSKKGAHKQKK